MRQSSQTQPQLPCLTLAIIGATKYVPSSCNGWCNHLKIHPVFSNRFKVSKTLWKSAINKQYNVFWEIYFSLYKRVFVLRTIEQFLPSGWFVHKIHGKKVFFFCNSSPFYLFKLTGLMGVNVPSEIKRFNCVTPISVSRRSITKRLSCALNECLSMTIHRLLSSKHFKKLRTVVPINAALVTVCNNYQHVQQRNPRPDRRYWAGIEGPDSAVSSSDLSSSNLWGRIKNMPAENKLAALLCGILSVGP